MRSIIHTVQTGAPVETLYLSEPTTVEKRRCPSDVGIVFIPRLITKKNVIGRGEAWGFCFLYIQRQCN